MGYFDVMNGKLLYLLVIAGLSFIAWYCFWMIKNGSKRAEELGVSKQAIKDLIKGTITFSIVPSLSVVVGLFTLSTALGVPWAWFRLSVLGAVGYELTAADIAATAAGFESINAVVASGDPSVAGIIMLAMSSGIIGGCVFTVLLSEPIHSGMSGLNAKWGVNGAIVLGCLTLAMLAVMVPRRTFVMGAASTAVFITSAAITYAIRALSAKNPNFKWMRDFTMAFALILGMASTLIWQMIF